MLNFFIEISIAMITNKMAVIMGKCSILSAWSPAITTADKITILSLSYLDNLIMIVCSGDARLHFCPVRLFRCRKFPICACSPQLLHSHFLFLPKNMICGKNSILTFVRRHRCLRPEIAALWESTHHICKCKQQ